MLVGKRDVMRRMEVSIPTSRNEKTSATYSVLHTVSYNPQSSVFSSELTG